VTDVEDVFATNQAGLHYDWDSHVLIDRMPIGISRAKLSGEILYANQALARMLGYERADEIIGTDAAVFYKFSQQRAELAQLLRHKNVLENIEVVMITKQGEERTFLINFWHHDEVLSAMLMDITERKRNEAALQLSRARLDSIIGSAMDAIISIDVNRQIILFNGAAERMFGCSADEAMGKPIETFIPERFRAQHADRVHSFGKEEPIHDAMGVTRDIYGLRVNGEEFPIEASVSQVEAGDLRFFTVILRDITERKKAEEQAKAAAMRLQVLSDASRAFAEHVTDYQSLLKALATRIADSLTCACFVRLVSEDNEWISVAAGHDANSQSQLVAKSLYGALRWRLADSPKSKQVLETGEALIEPDYDLEQLHPLLPPELWAVVRSFKIKNSIWVPLLLNGQRLGILTLVRHDTDLPPFNQEDLRLACDLTDRATLAINNARLFQRVEHELGERKQAEIALENERALLTQRVAARTADLNTANAELGRVAKLKDEFLASMSHELRTPLNSVLGRSEALLEGVFGPLNKKQIESIHGIEESGRHLLELINDILDLSKIESGKLSLEIGTVAVEPLCTLSVRMIAQAAHQKQVKLTTTIDNSVEAIEGDERRLKQILVNLLSNAVKFTPSGGKIGLEVLGDEATRTVSFTVWDTGIGIAEKDLARLFKPFVQIDSSLTRKYAGTGLGLSLVKTLAEAHHGSVMVHSVPDQGSRFTVTLPWQQ